MPWTSRARVLLAALAALLVLGSAPPAEAGDLYARHAGFAKARARPRRSVTVQADFAASRLAPLLARWNAAAGWALFVPVARNGDVRFVRGGPTYVQGLPSNTTAFTSCVIHYDAYDTHTLTHEIGHCLGLADSVRWSADMTRWVNPSQCDRPDKAGYSGYRGVMSYCDWHDERAWFGRADRALLKRTGYRP
jgi:hypothetical protein